MAQVVTNKIKSFISIDNLITVPLPRCSHAIVVSFDQKSQRGLIEETCMKFIS